MYLSKNNCWYSGDYFAIENKLSSYSIEFYLYTLDPRIGYFKQLGEFQFYDLVFLLMGDEAGKEN